MTDNQPSRRQFIKLVSISLVAFLVSCKKRLAPAVSPTAPPTEIDHTPTPSNTETPTPTATATSTPTATQTPSFRLLTPEDGAVLPAIGKVTFSWESMPEAVNYEFTIILPTGQPAPFQTPNTFRDQYIEVFRLGGKYTWQVTAFDINGTVLFSTEPFTFKKPETLSPTASSTPPADNDGSASDDSSTSGDSTSEPNVTINDISEQ